MTSYILRRLLSVIPITIGVMLITFFVFRVVGGNPAYRIAGKNATPARIAQISHERGYDTPLFLDLHDFPRQLFDAQFPQLCRNLVRLDFGESLVTRERVSTMLREGVLPSLCVTTPLFVIELTLGIALALVATFYRDTLDRSQSGSPVGHGHEHQFARVHHAGAVLAGQRVAAVPGLGL